MLAATHKAAFHRILRPIAVVLVRLGVHPSAITIGCPLLMALVCYRFLQTRAVGPFCVAALAVGALDGLDGAVAREGGQASAFGAYLDALCDRYVDAMIAMTAAVVTGYWMLCMLVLVGGLLVSYAKARAAMEAPVSNTEWPDLMERTERGVLFLAGLAAGVFIPVRPFGRDLFWWTLVVLAVLVHLTVIQRMRRAAAFIRKRA